MEHIINIREKRTINNVLTNEKMICQNKKNNPLCEGKIEGKPKYAKGMKVCERCFYKLSKEGKEGKKW